MRAKGLLCVAMGCAMGAGCVERSIDVTSNPPGALVTANDQEIGRTPFSRQFTWYGTYEVQVRKDGYQTFKAETPVIAPWWQWIGFDLIAEILPVRLEDHHEISYTLKPFSDEHSDPESLVQRAQGLRERLDEVPTPTTQPSPKPEKPKPKSAPTTQPK
jgi:hypothetical protein